MTATQERFMPPIPAEQTSPYGPRLIPAPAVAGRYGIHLRSISRWVARGVIPPPDQIINDRRYWFLETLERADRQRTVERAAKNHAPTAA
jgi:hypothetical protein